MPHTAYHAVLNLHCVHPYCSRHQLVTTLCNFPTITTINCRYKCCGYNACSSRQLFLQTIKKSTGVKRARTWTTPQSKNALPQYSSPLDYTHNLMVKATKWMALPTLLSIKSYTLHNTASNASDGDIKQYQWTIRHTFTTAANYGSSVKKRCISIRTKDKVHHCCLCCRCRIKDAAKDFFCACNDSVFKQVSVILRTWNNDT